MSGDWKKHTPGWSPVSEQRGAAAILMYHHVAHEAPAEFRKYSVSPAAFAAQMRLLRLLRYRVVGLDTCINARKAGTRLPRRTAVITFDDGFADTVHFAVPVLHALGFTATFFIVAGRVGGRSDWLEEPMAQYRLIDSESIRSLHRSGFLIGAHSMTHRRLTRMPRRDCARELMESRLKLEDITGSSPAHMAYPFGDYDADVRALAAEAGYESACSVRIGRSRPSDDQLALHRIPVSGADTLLDFAARLGTGRALRESAAGAVRRALGLGTDTTGASVRAPGVRS